MFFKTLHLSFSGGFTCIEQLLLMFWLWNVISFWLSQFWIWAMTIMFLKKELLWQASPRGGSYCGFCSTHLNCSFSALWSCSVSSAHFIFEKKMKWRWKCLGPSSIQKNDTKTISASNQQQMINQKRSWYQLANSKLETRRDEKDQMAKQKAKARPDICCWKDSAVYQGDFSFVLSYTLYKS